MNKNFRIAIIGCGSICGNHIKSILESENTLCAVCDILPEQTERIKEKYSLGDLPVYTDYKEMIDTERPDSVHICTPHYLHAEMICYALSKDVNVLSEKPLFISLEQMEDIKKAVKATKAQLGVCHQNRYEENMLTLKRLTADGVKGGGGFVLWNRNADYYNSASWRGTVAMEGGGVMINQALHTLDILQWICGMPKYVTAHTFCDTLKGVIEVEDTATARFELEDGTALTFFATNGAGCDLTPRLEFKLMNGETVVASNKLVTLNKEVVSGKEKESYEGKAVWGTGHAKLISDFYSAIREGRHFDIDFEEGSKVVRLILAMYRSNGERIEI